MLYFCYDCKRIIKEGEKCNYCNSEDLGELVVGAPISVFGTKEKGKVLKIIGDKVRVLIKTEGNDKVIREYSIDKLKKVL